MGTKHRQPGVQGGESAATLVPETLLERIANAATHGVGAGLALAGLVLLVASAAVTDNAATTMVAVVVYGVSLVFLFLSSTLYHCLFDHRVCGRLLEAFDHVGIFLLIAGTYTPFTLIALPAEQGWFLFGTIWALAAGGILLRLFWIRYLHPAFVVVYVVMGWLGLLFGGTIARAIGPQGLDLLVLGGLFYTGGLVFFAWRRLPFNHMVWHLFVLAGSILHFFAVYHYVVPRAAI